MVDPRDADFTISYIGHAQTSGWVGSSRVGCEDFDSDNAEWWSDEGRAAILAKDCRAATQSIYSHKPDLGFTCRTVMPKNIGFFVPIKIANSHNAEWRTNKGRIAVLAKDRCTVSQLVAGHKPDLDFACGTVMPKNIGFLVPIKIANSNNAEWRTDESG